ncbi:MAG TPA: pyruvate dehydrogenase (acetyl-transferring) E1 component subunit alpha [Anaerolineales bacterium]|nr:pyruvate dehydrogenase (acetyl-transferring) E1 component subunit alpha [Anaerolineales bacterium]
MNTKTMNTQIKDSPTKKKSNEREHLHHLLHEMVLIRRYEEKAAELYQATKIRGFLHLYIGEEAIAVGVMQSLNPEDSVVATYREHGHALARGVSADVIMAEMYGKLNGCSRGRGGSMHLFDKTKRFFGGNAIVCSHLPLAVGIALADKMQNKPNVTVCFLGEGAVAEGEFHESLNLGSLWQTPTLFVVENNLYCMGTALRYHESNTNLAEKAASYNVQSVQVDGNDVLAVEEATREACDYLRSGKGPYFIEAITYRFRPHSMFDAELYRNKAEVEEAKKRDPIILFTNYLKDKKLIKDEDIQAIEKDVAETIQHAVDFAEASPWESLEDLTRFVYTERSQP